MLTLRRRSLETREFKFLNEKEVMFFVSGCNVLDLAFTFITRESFHTMSEICTTRVYVTHLQNDTEMNLHEDDRGSNSFSRT